MLRKIIFTSILFIAGFTPASSQNYLLSYLGDSTNIDIGSRTIETFDGNIVISGITTWSSLGYDGMLLKLNLAGDTLWTKTFGDTSINNQITGGYVTQLSDSGFLLVYSLTTQSCADIILLFRLDDSGDTLWTKSYGFGHNEADEITSIIETPDNGFIAVGLSDHGNNNTTDMRGLVMKLDMNGDTIWTKTYKNFDNTYFEDIQQTPESDYIICGTSSDADSTNGFYINLLKIDGTGNTIWIKYFGLPGFSSARKLEISYDGYLITGETVINNNFRNYILKTDSSGNSIWCKKYEFAPYIGVNSKLTKCSSGGYYFSENICDSTFVWNSLLLKINDDGIPIWNGLYGGKPASYINDIYGTNDGGCLLAGQYADTLLDFPFVFLVEQDLLVIKADSTGYVNCHYNQTVVTYDSLSTVEVFLPLTVSSGINQYDNTIIVKSGYPESHICTITGKDDDITRFISLNVYPNPSNGDLSISGFDSKSRIALKLFDSRGNLVMQKIQPPVLLDLINLELNFPDGLYFLQLTVNEISYFNKVIIIND